MDDVQQPDERETKLPLWVKEKLAKLRDQTTRARQWAEGLQSEFDARRAAEDAEYNADTTDVRYDTKYGTQYLEPGGLLTFRIGTLEISVRITVENPKEAQ